MGPVQLLAAAIALLPSTGSPSGDYAETLAAEFHRCADDLGRSDVDAELIAAVAWLESGFRIGAVNKNKDRPHVGRMLGVFQLAEKFLPPGFPWENVHANATEFCAKLRRTSKAHDVRCKAGHHHVIAHHFSGYRITPKAIETSKDVLRRRTEILRVLARLMRS